MEFKSLLRDALPIIIPMTLALTYAFGVANFKFHRGWSTKDALLFPRDLVEIVSDGYTTLAGEEEDEARLAINQQVSRAKIHQEKIQRLLKTPPKEPSGSPSLESLLGLSGFVTQGSVQPPEESKKAIENGMVQMRVGGVSRWSGMLLTHDGWFITAGHCLKPFDTYAERSGDFYFGHWKDMSHIGRKEWEYFSVTPFLFYDPKQDIAIGKAYIPDTQKVSILANIYERGATRRGQPVQVFGFQDYGRLYRQIGRVTRPTHLSRTTDEGASVRTDDLLGTDAYIKPGFSGGVVIDDETGGFMGITPSSSEGDGPQPASAVKLKYVLRLINNAVERTLRGNYGVELK